MLLDTHTGETLQQTGMEKTDNEDNKLRRALTKELKREKQLTVWDANTGENYKGYKGLEKANTTTQILARHWAKVSGSINRALPVLTWKLP